MKIALLILTYNEIQGMKEIFPKIDKKLFSEILIVDGGSNDGTIEFAKKHKIKFIIQKNKGLGSAYVEGISLIKSDVIVLFSPDGNSDLTRMKDLIELMKTGCQIGIVSRYKDWAKSEDDDLITGFGNWMFTLFFNLIFKQKVTDLLVIYRAFRREIVYDLNINHGGIAWTTQMMCRAAKNSYVIKEIPGDEPPRIGGIRKMQPLKNGLAELIMLSKEFLRFKKDA